MINKIVNKTVNIFLLCVFIISAIFLLSAINSGSMNEATFFGYKLFYIVSPSMEPTIMTGDLVIGSKINAEQIQTGDIVGYKKDGIIIIHRVIEVNDDIYTIQGDNNLVTDDPVTRDQILYVIRKDLFRKI